MSKQSEHGFGTDEVIFFLDMIVVLLIEEEPIIGIVLVALLKSITHELLPRVGLIILIIAMSVFIEEEETVKQDSQNAEQCF